MHSMAYSCVIGVKWGDYHCANWGDLSVSQLGRFIILPNGAICL